MKLKITILLLILLIATIYFNKTNSRNMVFGININMKILDMEHLMLSKNCKYKLENSTTENTDRNRAVFTTISTEYCKDDNFSGKLKIDFFNNELLSIYFYPDDREKFIRYLNLINNANISKATYKDDTIFIYASHKIIYRFDAKINDAKETKELPIVLDIIETNKKYSNWLYSGD